MRNIIITIILRAAEKKLHGIMKLFILYPIVYKPINKANLGILSHQAHFNEKQEYNFVSGTSAAIGEIPPNSLKIPLVIDERWRPVHKNNGDHTHSCPREFLLSAFWGPPFRPP